MSTMSNEIWVSIAGVALAIISAFVTSLLLIGKYREKVDALERKYEKIETEIHKMSGDLRECTTKIEERTSSSQTKYAKRGSPMMLTPDGQSLLKQSGGDKFIEKNKDEFVEKLRAMNPRSAYDVQESAKQVFEKMQNEDRFIPFKDFAFNEGLSLDILFLVLGLHLRDIAMPLLGFKMEDLDKVTA
jgi:hypothetical protein